MPYKKIGPGKYTFTLTWEHERFRKGVTCPHSHVETIYRAWEQEIFNRVTGKHRLFDILKEYLSWSKRHKSKRMFAAEEDHARLIAEFFGDHLIHEIKRHNILDFAAWRKTRSLNPKRQNVSNDCVKGTVQTFSFILNWCRERAYIRDNPVFNLRLRRSAPRVVVLSPDQIRAILGVAKGHQITFLLIALTTGLRHSEILGLRWKEVSLDKRLISLSGERTKSRRNRQVVFPEVLFRHLHELSEERMREFLEGSTGEDRAARLGHFLESYVILYEGKPIKSFQTSWETIRKRTGMKDLRIHDLRHAYATTLRASGMALAEIKELLGHKDLATTQRYAHFDGMIRGNVGVFDSILRVEEAKAPLQIA